MKKKVLVFHPTIAPYRVDFFNVIAQRFDARFYFYYRKSSSLTFSDGYLSPLCNFKLNYLEKSTRIFKRSFVRGLTNIIGNEKPEIIICSEFNPVTISIFISYLINQKPYRLFTICDDSLENAKNRKGLRSFFRNIISKNIDGVIFPSQTVGEWVQQNIAKNINTFELPIIHKDEIFRNKLTQSLKLTNDLILKYNLNGKKVILFVGRLVEVKNLSLLIDACANQKTSDWKLFIIGSGPQEENLRNQVKHHNLGGRIHFLGKKESNELFAWYNLGQLFILPSTFEPFGAVVNEALLSGCMVLCSEQAGASTLISSTNGILFNAYELKDIIKKMKIMLKEIQPIAGPLMGIKENRMPFSFDRKVSILLNSL